MTKNDSPAVPDLSRAVEPLLSWFSRAARPLPWRQSPTPYGVWVSEVMLQQTRVAAVIPYYNRFMAALPTVEALARAPEDRVLKLWEGLGYYTRARALQKAARYMAAHCGGEVPGDYATLSALPGIGPYTAGAVASIAFGLAVPAVDGNVLRVVCRLGASPMDIARPGARALVEGWLAPVIPQNAPGAFNQALMELGATVCLPAAPRCDLCPLSGVCAARAAGLQYTLPVKSPKKPRRAEERTGFVVEWADGILLQKRPATGLLAGLWEPPCAPATLDRAGAVAFLAAAGLSPLRLRPLPPARHIFTHVEWHMTGWAVRADATGPLPAPFVAAGRAALGEEYTLPSAYDAYLGLWKRKGFPDE